MSALAVMAARNEAGYIEVALRSMIDEGLEVVLLDHGSVDGTRELAERFRGNGLLEIRDVPWRGTFDLAEMLRAKEEVYSESPHDWHVHVDADEWLRATHDVPRAEFLNSNVDPQYVIVNFQQFVFLPPTGADMWGMDYRVISTRYYCFAQTPKQHMRPWRRGSVGSIVDGAGHTFPNVPVAAVFPEDQALRHYIGLSWSHAIAKRADRTYPGPNWPGGWHRNRLDLRAARPVEDSQYVKMAELWDTRALDTSTPTRFHFWQPGFHEPRTL
jgi:hypothetical protein